MKRSFRTDLDLDERHLSVIRDLNFDETPQIGSKIALEPDGGPVLFLEVHSVLYSTRSRSTPFSVDRVIIELHLECSVWKERSLRQFYEFYAPQVGRSVSSFV